MADGSSSGIVDTALDAAGSIVDSTAQEVKQSVSTAFQQITGSSKQVPADSSHIRELEQRDRIESGQKEAALSHELRMIAHNNAQQMGVGIRRENHPESIEDHSHLSDLETLNNPATPITPLNLKQAHQRMESGKNTQG